MAHTAHLVTLMTDGAPKHRSILVTPTCAPTTLLVHRDLNNHDEQHFLETKAAIAPSILVAMAIIGPLVA